MHQFYLPHLNHHIYLTSDMSIMKELPMQLTNNTAKRMQVKDIFHFEKLVACSFYKISLLMLDTNTKRT